MCIDQILNTAAHVELDHIDNPWKPNRCNVKQRISSKQKKTEELIRKIRGILNKLTIEKCDVLINQVKELSFETKDDLQSIVNLIFEKAVDEPLYCNAYALFCKQLSQLEVIYIIRYSKKNIIILKITGVRVQRIQDYK